MCVAILNFVVIFSSNSHLIATTKLVLCKINIMMFGVPVFYSLKVSTLFILCMHIMYALIFFCYKLLCNDTCGTSQLKS